MKKIAAQTAKLIRQDIKALGIKAKVQSDNFAGGDAVRVTVIDQNPEISKLLKDAIEKYQYGSFNSMEDTYDITNAQDFPQVKYVTLVNERSDEMNQEILDYIKSQNIQDVQNLPEKYEDFTHKERIFDEFASAIINRVFHNSCYFIEGFWDQRG